MLRQLLSRGTAMFVLGAYGFIHEVRSLGAERPWVLFLCGTLMGLPFVLSTDVGAGPFTFSLGRKNTAKEQDEGEDEGEGEGEDRWSHLP